MRAVLRICSRNRRTDSDSTTAAPPPLFPPRGLPLLSACDGRMWEYALGCAGRRKKVDSLCSLGDVQALDGGLRYSDGGMDSTPSCTIPILRAEEGGVLSNAPTREASLKASPAASLRASPAPPSPWSHGSSGAGPDLFIAVPQSGASPTPKRVKPAADSWRATCAACCAPISGAIFMGGGRAYCSAAACEKSSLHVLPASAHAGMRGLRPNACRPGGPAALQLGWRQLTSRRFPCRPRA